MKQGTVKFSKEFITPIGLKEWVTIEYPLDFNHENVYDVYDRVVEMVNKCHERNQIQINPEYAHLQSVPPGPPPVINVERTSEDVRIAELIKDIYACTQLTGSTGLESYRKIADTNSATIAAYEVMRNKLTKKESQELLDATNDFYEKRKNK